MIDYTDKIPNNVDLGRDRVLQRALEHWQPAYLSWWYDMGPNESHNFEVYLRTAISVEPDGWAQFDYVKMPEYRWGIFLQPRDEKRQVISACTRASPPGKTSRANIAPFFAASLVTQGDTEPASVEQQKMLGLSCPSLYDLPQHLSGERRGRPPPLGHGLPVTPLFRPRWPRRSRILARTSLRRHGQPPNTGSVQRANSRLARLLHVHLLHRSRRQVSAMRPGRIRPFDPLAPHLPIHASLKEAHHMFVGESGISRIIQRTCEVMKENKVGRAC